MILNDPKPPEGSSTFVHNGSITLNWEMQDGDPQIISFDLGNNTTDVPLVWTIGVQVSTSLLTYTAQLPPTAPAQDNYFVQAGALKNGFGFVLAQTPHTFRITNESTPTTTMNSSSSTQTHLTSISEGPSVIPARPSVKPVNTGAIAGGTVGGILAIVVIFFLLVFFRRRTREKRLSRTLAKRGNKVPDPYPVPSSNPPSTFTTLSLHKGDLKGERSDYSSDPSNLSSRLRRGTAESMSEPTTIYPSDSRSQRNHSRNSGSATGTHSEDIELRSRLEQMAERVRHLEMEREYWGETPPDYMSSAGDDATPSQGTSTTRGVEQSALRASHIRSSTQK